METMSSVPLNSKFASSSGQALPLAGEKLSRPNRLAVLLAWLACLRSRQRQRAALRRLDIRLLRDIGISPASAAAEAGKWPWQP